MTSTSRSSRDESSGATDEGVVTSSSNDHEGLTTLDGRRRVTLVTLVLVDSERFTGDGRLINLEERVIGNNTTISRNDSSLDESLERVPLLNRSQQNRLTSSIWRISPGTTWGASISKRRPSRRTTAFRARVFFNSSTIEPAWYSCTKPTQALSSKRAQMTPKSTQSSRPAARMAAA
ncbi:hypothetical protein Q9L58_005466 [Maublancomyces gigas]|uniref:Uncharacterized protein n=1 Tax=Discina gigas TaxID=1032678 RepID=A0ABR3GI05_9PEZI